MNRGSTGQLLARGAGAYLVKPLDSREFCAVRRSIAFLSNRSLGRRSGTSFVTQFDCDREYPRDEAGGYWT
jgi:hypothetical protein